MGPIQKRQLRTYLYFRDRPMSVWSLARHNWLMLLLTYGFGTAAAAFFFGTGDHFTGWLLVAAFLAVACRDLGNFIRWSRTWPLTRSLLHWPTVETLAAQNHVAA